MSDASDHPIKTFTKLIEVALPLEKINEAAVREKSIRHGHPSTLHLWWARRPLAAARAVIFAQMVDDPSAHPDQFPTEEAQTAERERLFRIIEELVLWESTTNEEVLERARAEIRRSWRDTCTANADHPRAAELFNPDVLPGFHDPFAGGGALPLEAQRLGLVSHASDLNPVAVLINKAMIEIPPRFAGLPPVNPESRTSTADHLIHDTYHGAAGLAADIRHYGRWMRERAAERIGHLYPTVTITDELVASRPDLKQYRGRSLTVIAWLWARTVMSPDPAFRSVSVPLVSNFMLSTKKGKEAYVEPRVEGGTYRFTVQPYPPRDAEAAKAGTTMGKKRGGFLCLMSGTPIGYDYIRAEGKAGRMDARLMAIVCEGDRGRVYLDPLPEHEDIARSAEPTWRPSGDVPAKLTGGTCVPYGLTEWGDLFTLRQLTALTTFSDLVGEAIERVTTDARAAGIPDDDTALAEGGTGARAYGEAVGVYLGLSVDRCADFNNSTTRWVAGNQKVMNLFAKQAIAMTWDYPEANILHETVGGFYRAVEYLGNCLPLLGPSRDGHAVTSDASAQRISFNRVVSTDPPYYDNIGYADLSDFFYVWMRRTLRVVYPDLLATMTVPKMEELVATPYRHGGKTEAEQFFLSGMTAAMHQIATQAHGAFPVTIYYAFKQAEKNSEGVASTGWETFLAALITAGFSLTGTWPVRSEQSYRAIGIGTNALASSIILVCRRRAPDAPVTTRARFIDELRRTLAFAIKQLQEANTPPVDMQQAAIGPGMAVYSRYREVREAEGTMSVHDALVLINETLDEILGHAEGDLDGHTRWAVTWFDQLGTAEGDYGTAESIANAKNVAVSAMVDAGVVVAKGGKVRLLRRDEMDRTWRPSTDKTFTVWEAVQHLVRVLADSGEARAAALYAELSADAKEGTRDLCYRLYNTCERKGWAEEAIGYNRLIAALPSIAIKAQSAPRAAREQGLFD
ncbi:MAG: DUF1156 domain-containing protein [Spirochaeta sp.]|jgi:putative DNA methylase|nr:DUF1156 domain-containing protein [Spirochaeta sp.]